MVLKLQDIDKTLLGSIDVLVISLTIELVHKIMRGALSSSRRDVCMMNVNMASAAPLNIG